MTIKAECACGKRFKAGDEYSGRKAVCPVCRREFAFPFQSVLTQPPPLVEPDPLTPGIVEQVSAEEVGSPQGSMPWWKDKIIVFGGGVPLLGLALFLGFVVWGRWQPNMDQDRSKPEQVGRSIMSPVSGVTPAGGAQMPTRNPKIPVEVSYPVMDEERDPPSRRAVRIAINMKVSEEILREIALEIKAKEIEQYQRTLVRFYLPPYWDGKDSWANVYFDPTLEVEILGLEEGQDQVVAGLKVTLPENSNLIGTWVSQEESFLITIYEAEGKYYMMRNFHNRKKKYPESDSAVFDLAKLPSTEEPTFQFSPIHDGGDKFVLSKHGEELFKYSDDTMKSVAKPVKKIKLDGSKR